MISIHEGRRIGRVRIEFDIIMICGTLLILSIFTRPITGTFLKKGCENENTSKIPSKNGTINPLIITCSIFILVYYF